MNNRGHILINRDPDPVDAGGGEGGAGEGAGAGAGAAGAGTSPGWLSTFEGVEVDHEVVNPETKARTIEKLSAKNDPAFNKYKTPADFYKGFREMQKMVGKKGVVPPANESPEELERFYNDLGRPKTPAEYKFSEIADLHPKIGNVTEINGFMSNVYHKLGLRPEQADGMQKEILNVLSASAKDQEAKQQKVIDDTSVQLRKDWSGDYDANLKRVGMVVSKALTPEELSALGGPEGLGSNPIIAKLIHKLSKPLSEDTIANLGGGRTSEGGGAGNETPQQAMKIISEINTDVNSDLYKAFRDDANPRHSEAVQLRSRMYKIAYPDGSS